jgi:hypothetical protein
MIVRPDEARRIMAEVIRRKGEWRPRIQSWHHEAGASLILYGMLRVNLTRRLDQDGWRIGASLARSDFDQ